MQVFIIGTPLETAISLDSKRLHKQILEARQIIKTISGQSESWKNHPCVLQYRDHLLWLNHYCNCLENYRDGDISEARLFDIWAEELKPSFHNIEYFNQMKRRLYTKNPDFYVTWSDLGKSDENWYFVDGVMRCYILGKRIR